MPDDDLFSTDWVTTFAGRGQVTTIEECEKIQQGVNQLQNIPSMPDDDLFSTDWVTSFARSDWVTPFATSFADQSSDKKQITTIEEGFDKLVNFDALFTPKPMTNKNTNPFR